MKEATWEDCLLSNSSLKVTPDKSKAKALIEVAKARIEFTKKSELDEKNANFIFEDYYSSLLEIVHALVLKKGYKVSNHVCLGFYLRDVLKRDDLFRVFDDCRKKRHGLVYYGKRMSLETAKDRIGKIKKTIPKLENF